MSSYISCLHGGDHLSCKICNRPKQSINGWKKHYKKEREYYKSYVIGYSNSEKGGIK